MQRIAVILGRLVIGGTTMDTLQALFYLQHHYEILLITGGKTEGEMEAKYLTEKLQLVRQERVDGFSGSLSLIDDRKAYRQIKQLLITFKPRLVHTHSAKAGLIGRLAATAAKVPVIVHTYHGTLFHGYYHQIISNLIIKLEQWLGKKTSCIVALSDAQREQLTNTYKIVPAEKIEVLPLGIETTLLTNNAEQLRQVFRNTYSLGEEDVAIGIIGRIVPIKNHLFFLKVVRKVLDNQVKNIRFFIIGDGVLRTIIEQECTDLSIPFSFFPVSQMPSTVTFTSWQTDMAMVINGLDVVTLTSINEGTPVSLLEAQACGKPVVSTHAGNVEDIITEGKTGFVLPQGNLEEFTKALMLLIKSPMLRAEMGKAAQEFARSNFDKTVQIKKLKTLYDKLVWQTF